MSSYRVRVQVVIVLAEAPAAGDNGEALDAHADKILVELQSLTTASRASTSSAGVYDFMIDTEAPAPSEAVFDATSTLRSAAHAAGAYTPGWPNKDEWDMWVTEREVQATPIAEITTSPGDREFSDA